MDGPLCRGLFAVLILFQSLVVAKLFGKEDSDCNYNIVSSPLKLGGVLVFEIWTKRVVMKKLLRNRGLVERRVRIDSSFFLKKSMFPLLLEYFFLSGKYSHLL